MPDGSSGARPTDADGGRNRDAWAGYPDIPRLSPPPDARASSNPDAGRADASPGIDARPAGLVVTIESPGDGDLLVDQQPVLRGAVAGIGPRGRVLYVVDEEGPTGDLVITEGRFEIDLPLSEGTHTITVTASDGSRQHAVSVSFRLAYVVRVVNGRLRIRGRPFQLVGLNAPSLHEDAWRRGNGDGSDRVAEIFNKAQRLGVTAVRTRAYDDRPGEGSAIQTGPDQYNESGLVALDRVIAQAGDTGLKLLLPLVDSGDRWGGIDQYLRWHGVDSPEPADRRRFYEPGPIREHFKSHARALLGRVNSVNGLVYNEDPTILGWEIFDGVDAAEAFDATHNGAPVEDFFTDVSALIKSIAPNQLVGTGGVGFDASSAPYDTAADTFREAGLIGLLDGSHGVAWHRNIGLPDIDFATLQLAPDAWGFPLGAETYTHLGIEWIRSHRQIAAAAAKPLLVTNAGLSAQQALDLESRRQVLRSWLAELGQPTLSGFVVGNFYPDGFDPARDRWAWFFRSGTEAEDPENLYADLIQEAARSVAR